MKNNFPEFKNYFERRVSQCCFNKSEPVEQNLSLSSLVRNTDGVFDILMVEATISTTELPCWSVAIVEYPERSAKIHGCAVMIGKNVAVTSFHNVSKDGNFVSGLWVNVGDHSVTKGNRVKIKRICTTPALVTMDLAILFLDLPEEHQTVPFLDIIDHRQFIDLQNQQAHCLVAGWGYTKRDQADSSVQLKDLAMRLGPFNVIEDFPLPSLYRVISCNGGGPCQKDSGSGLFVLDSAGKPLLAGIASRISDQSMMCHSDQYPALYSNIALAKSEIEDLLLENEAS